MSVLRAAHERLQKRLRCRKPNGRFTVPDAVTASVAGLVRAQPRMLELLLPHNPGRHGGSRRTFAAVVACLVACADWSTGAITVTHEAIGAAAGARCGRAAFSHDTVGRVVAVLTAAGVLVCPDGMGGKSCRAFGGRGRNQCPTYFVVDPDATSADTDLRTPPSHVSETVEVGGTTALYKGPIFPKFAGFDSGVVPRGRVQCATAAQWLRSELHVGAVPNWLMAAMMARHFRAGLSPRQVFQRVCTDPDGVVHPSLPTGDRQRAGALARSPHRDLAGMLLGIIGSRLRRWSGVIPPAPVARAKPAAAVPAVQRSRMPGSLRQATQARIAAGQRQLREREAAIRDRRRAAPC